MLTYSHLADSVYYMKYQILLSLCVMISAELEVCGDVSRFGDDDDHHHLIIYDCSQGGWSLSQVTISILTL